MADEPMVLVHRLDSAQQEQLVALYREEWWTLKRTQEQVTTMLEHSDHVYALVRESGDLIGFSRVLTDYVFKALILDVMVQPAYRGKRLGRRMMDIILKDPALAGVAQFELYCLPEMVPFYQKWGFSDELAGLTFMRKQR